VAQRNGVETVVENVTRESDLTALSIRLLSWGNEKTRKVATHIGLSRLKDMVSMFGDDVVVKLVPAELEKVRPDDSATVLADVTALLDRLGDRRAMARLPRLAMDWSVSLPELLRASLTGLSRPTIDLLRPAIAAASESERKTAADDDALMTLAKKTMDENSYLELLPALGMHKAPTKGKIASGESAHTSAADADKRIRSTLAAYVVGAIRAGRQVEGEVSVVGDEDFQMAFDRQWVRAAGQSFAGKKAWQVCNAFVDVNLPERRIWVHRDMGNAGTVIHEGMHKYADPTLRNEQIAMCQVKKIPYGGISQLDEGITEYFTRKVDPSRKNYQDPFEVASELAARCGERVVAAAYYDGVFDPVKAALGVAWANFAEKVERKDWNWLEINGYK
jgi:hypothetical protein